MSKFCHCHLQFNFISWSLLPDVLFPCPMPFFSHLPFFCCPFPPSSSWGHFFTTIHCSCTSKRHSAKDKQLQSERCPCLSPSWVFCQQETIKQLFWDRTSPTILIIWHFSIFICQNHWDCAILVSVLKSLQLNYGFLEADGGEPSKPSKPHHNFKSKCFTRQQNEGKET